MMTPWLLVCFAAFWCSSHAIENDNSVIDNRFNLPPRPFTGLLFDWEEKKLVEISRFDNEAICESCISACPARSNSKKENLINKVVSITGNGIFEQHIYSQPNITARKMDTACESALIPALVWDTEEVVYNVGYEMFYEKSSVKLRDKRYDDFFKVVDGEPSTEKKQLPSEYVIRDLERKKYTKFIVVADVGKESKKKVIFYWIDVLSIHVIHDEKDKIRTIYKKDDIINNNYLPLKTIPRCESYFSDDGTKIIGEQDATDGVPPQKLDKKRPAQNTDADGGKFSKKRKTNTKQPKNRLVKTQILPMIMFHTQAARLATCVYLNMAFVWETVAKEVLNKVDLYLYALYLTFHDSAEIEIYFSVSGESQELDATTREEIQSEHSLFAKFPVPRGIFRIVEIKVNEIVYAATVVIHNNVKSVRKEDRVCSVEEELGGWEGIKNTKDAPGFSYACADVRKYERKDEIPHLLKLDDFHYSIGANKGKSALDQINETLERIKI